MKDEKLISELSENLRPVHRIHPPLLTFAAWMGFSFCSLILFVWWRSENFQNTHFPVYYFELIPVVTFLSLAAYFAILQSIPGMRIEIPILILPFVLLVSWIGSLLFRFMYSPSIPEPFAYPYHHCIEDSILMSLPTTLFFLSLVKGRYFTSMNSMSFWIFSASACASFIGESFLCPNETAKHMLLVHGTPVLLFSLIGWLMGSFIIPEPSVRNLKK